MTNLLSRPVLGQGAAYNDDSFFLLVISIWCGKMGRVKMCPRKLTSIDCGESSAENTHADGATSHHTPNPLHNWMRPQSGEQRYRLWRCFCCA